MESYKDIQNVVATQINDKTMNEPFEVYAGDYYRQVDVAMADNEPVVTITMPLHQVADSFLCQLVEEALMSIKEKDNVQD